MKHKIILADVFNEDGSTEYITINNHGTHYDVIHTTESIEYYDKRTYTLTNIKPLMKKIKSKKHIISFI